MTLESDTTDRDERLGEAIEAYLEQAEAGPPPDPDEFSGRYPDLEPDLREALDGLALVQNLVGSTAGTGPGRALESGRRVAGYRIVRELGRGGMGTVYEAVHVDLDRPVALKVLGASAAPDSTGRRRFLNEAKTAASLHHTHIVPVFDVGQVGGLCYYAMQRIEGAGLDRVVRALRRDRTTGAGTTSRHRRSPGVPAQDAGGLTEAIGTATPDLTRRDGRDRDRTDQLALTPGRTLAGTTSGPDLAGMTASWGATTGGRRRGGLGLGPREQEQSPFDPPRGSDYYRWVAQVGRQTGEALAHAHRRHIIHRDIKPSNLLVDARGSIWVADFGLARHLADPGITHTDSLLGTPRYMSPEQTQTGPIDGRTDVYSLGATLYELLTLRPPFDGQSAVELVQQIRQRDPIAPRKLDPRIPRDLETIVLKAMAKRPADRYATAADLAQDLERFLAFEPVQARRIGPIGRAWRYARRHPSLTAVSTTAAAAILATATWAHLNVVQERNEALKAKAQTQQALRQTQLAMQGEQAARREALWREAQAVRVSAMTGRRRLGLERLREAASLGTHLDPALRVRLRDEAAQFLSLRDLEPLSPLATGRAWGLTFLRPAASASGETGRDAEPSTLAVLNDTGDTVMVWDRAGDGAQWRLPLEPGSPATDRPGASGEPAAPLRPGRLFGLEREGESPRFGAGVAAVGHALAVVRPDGQGVRLLAPGTGAVLADWNLPGPRIESLLATPDGQRLITFERVNPGESGRDGGPGGRGPGRGGPGAGGPGGPQLWLQARLWDLAHPEAPLAVLADPTGPTDEPRRVRIPLVGFSPDGSLIAMAWSGFGPESDPAIHLIDAATGAERASIREVPASMSALALGPDGLLAVAVGDGSLRLWDLSGPTPEPRPGLYHHQAYARVLRFSPDGTLLAIAGAGAGIELWDPATNQQLATVRSPDRAVLDIEFAPDGHTLVATGPEQLARWAIVEPDGRARLANLPARPSALALGPDGLVALGSWSGPLGLWASDHGAAPARPLGDVRATALAFDAQGQLVVPEAGALAWYPPTSGSPASPLRRLPLPEPRWAIGFGPAGRPPAPPGPSTALSLLGLSRPALGPLDVLAGLIEALAQSSAEPGGPGGGPRRGGGPGGRPPGLVPTQIAVADGGRRLAIGRPGEVLGWSAEEPGQVQRLLVSEPERETDGDRLRGSRGGIPSFWSALALAPTGDRLYLAQQEPGRREGTLLAFALRSDGRAEPLTWAAAYFDVTALALSPDGKLLAVADPAGVVRLIETSHGRIASVLEAEADTEPTVTALAFSPDGRTLAAGHQHGRITLWRIGGPQPEPLIHLPGHPGGVLALSFGPQGDRLASIGDDKVAQVWDLNRLLRRLDALGLSW